MNATPTHRPVLVVDFGAQYAQLIARRVREAGVYSELVPHTITAAEVREMNPLGIVMSGGPSSVYEEGAPQFDPEVFELGVPMLGICYGFQIMAHTLGGTVGNTGDREYGGVEAKVLGDGGAILGGQPETQNVWMSHGDAVQEAPEGFDVYASTDVDPGCGVRLARAQALRRAVAPRGQALGSRPARARELLAPRRGHSRRLDGRQRDC